jgi:hypothetical protein
MNRLAHHPIEGRRGGGLPTVGSHRWLFFTDGSVSAGVRALARDGAILRPVI